MAVFKPDVEQPDGVVSIGGDQGNRFKQDEDRMVGRPGGTGQTANFPVDAHDLVAAGNYTTGVFDVGGASSISVSLKSRDTEQMNVVLEFYDDEAGTTKVATVDGKNDYSSLEGTKIVDTVPQFGDFVQVTVEDNSGAAANTIDGAINLSGGGPTVQRLVGQSGNTTDVPNLTSGLVVAGSEGILTYNARATEEVALDFLRQHVYDSSDTIVDPASEGQFRPTNKANLHNAADPGANTDILGADLTATDAPATFRVRVALDTSVVFQAAIDQGGTVETVTFNEGTALTAGALYTFDHPVNSNDSVNYQVASSSAIRSLTVDEYPSGAP